MKPDNVNHPPHYTAHPSGVECIEITEHLCFNIGNAIKYLWRCGSKINAIEDLKKAAWYINREIQLREKLKKAHGEARAETLCNMDAELCGEELDEGKGIFKAFQHVQHKGGSVYRILDTPDKNLRLEATNETFYSYRLLDESDKRMWFRCKAEMEDGRFTPYEEQ